MANPQKENGYIAIANEIAEHLSFYRLSGQEYQVLWIIWRKTWGWNKKEDPIALSQFSELNKMKKSAIVRALNKLISKNVIIKKDNGNGNIYRFNKDFDQWKALSKKITTIKGVLKKDNGGYSKKITPTRKRGYSKKSTTKDNLIKPTITKPGQANACEELKPLIALFKEVNPTYERLFENTTQRDALDRLVKKFTYTKIENLLKALPSIVSQSYAPKITTPFDLERDLGKLLLFIKGNQNKNLKNQTFKV